MARKTRKNYYTILGLPTPRALSTSTSCSIPPSLSSRIPQRCGERIESIESIHISHETLKQAFRRRLLECHPDKQQPPAPRSVVEGEEVVKYTIDDIKEAYSVLRNDSRRREWEAEMQRERWKFRGEERDAEEGEGMQEFILGLEVLDLDDFTAMGGDEHHGTGGERGVEGEEEGGDRRGDNERDEGGRDKGSTWTRPCRCGDTRGFVITEEELEECVRRGEHEVLVGCGGCSLWVRVGFGVVEE